MQNEIDAHERNNTWYVISLSLGKILIDYKWIYKIKYKANREIERYKMCVVAKRYNQIEGADYLPLLQSLPQYMFFLLLL